MGSAVFWLPFPQCETKKYEEKRAQEEIAKIRPRLWVLSRAELHPLAGGDFDEYYLELEERYE